MLVRAQRLVTAEEWCASRALPSTPVNDSWVLVSSQHGIAYCQLEKTGSSTMLTFLLEINGQRTKFRSNDDLHHTASRLFKQLGDDRVLLAHRLFSYVQVRHPFTRLVSCYCGKVLEKRLAFVLMFRNFSRLRDRRTEDIVKLEIPQYRFSRDAQGISSFTIISPPGKENFMTKFTDLDLPMDGSMPSFREFAVEVAVEILKCGTNQTCRTAVHASYGRQVDHCDPCEWSFDFLMKIETIGEDFPLLRRLVGHPKLQDSEAGPTIEAASEERRVNGRIAECRSTEHYLLQLSSVELDLVYTAFYEDFQMFGYEPFVF
ncbi:carbohydrate sulfotransferase 9 [Hyalella azteca]|uniref:Carbohydrate sulfotransferase n=1 Tax=Hyalella azteca TaxID=294128 RepID=A0A8B7NWP6_HYAAZ|nr:carbohydrate sulfotransferase 9 [Hyalella azteca]